MNQVQLVVRDDNPRAIATAERLAERLRGHGVAIDRDRPQAVVAIGGDGTVLKAAAIAVELGIPVCGINVGRIGYLAEFAESEIDDLSQAIGWDEFVTRRHNIVSVATSSHTATGINDVVVEKVAGQRIIEIAVRINDKPLATYRTDGMIVASALGSTAYSLSAGGPIVDPSLDALTLTPIAPHSLLTRAIVLSHDAVVTLTIVGDRPARIHVDGRELCTVSPDEPIIVQSGEESVRFLTLERHPFPHAVREHFGLDHA